MNLAAALVAAARGARPRARSRSSRKRREEGWTTPRAPRSSPSFARRSSDTSPRRWDGDRDEDGDGDGDASLGGFSGRGGDGGGVSRRDARVLRLGEGSGGRGIDRGVQNARRRDARRCRRHRAVRGRRERRDDEGSVTPAGMVGDERRGGDFRIDVSHPEREDGGGARSLLATRRVRDRRARAMRRAPLHASRADARRPRGRGVQGAPAEKAVSAAAAAAAAERDAVADLTALLDDDASARALAGGASAAVVAAARGFARALLRRRFADAASLRLLRRLAVALGPREDAPTNRANAKSLRDVREGRVRTRGVALRGGSRASRSRRRDAAPPAAEALGNVPASILPAAADDDDGGGAAADSPTTATTPTTPTSRNVRR